MDRNQKKIESLRETIEAVDKKIKSLEVHRRSLEISLQEALLKEERKALAYRPSTSEATGD